MKFAAFIMTYERENILKNTISKIFGQSYPPEKILIVDNSISDRTAKMIHSLDNPKVFYHRVGFNSGPAGGAAIGLQLLAEQGYDWIYWGDDDDPPNNSSIFEKLLSITERVDNCGVVGIVGQFFNTTTGNIERVSDRIIKGSGLLEVDTIAGNMIKIINAKMLRDYQIYPDEKLFFGFEDLDFDIKVKKIGFKLYVDKEIFHQNRILYNRIGLPKQLVNKPIFKTLWREYYSIRSLLFIFWSNGYYKAFFRLMIVKSLKIIYNFRYGFKLGFSNMKYTFLAFFHFLINKKGMTILPNKK